MTIEILLHQLTEPKPRANNPFKPIIDLFQHLNWELDVCQWRIHSPLNHNFSLLSPDNIFLHNFKLAFAIFYSNNAAKRKNINFPPNTFIDPTTTTLLHRKPQSPLLKNITASFPQEYTQPSFQLHNNLTAILTYSLRTGNMLKASNLTTDDSCPACNAPHEDYNHFANTCPQLQHIRNNHVYDTNLNP
jgi:hypothetical protein